MAGLASSVTGRRLRLISLVSMLVVFGASLTAHAFWGSTDSSNPAGAAADLLPQGATPTALATASTVDLGFARGTTASGREVTSYLVKRFDSALSGTESASFLCDWPPSTVLDCSEDAVADGGWFYSVTPHIAGSLWYGVESARSAGVTIDTTPPDPPSTPDLAASDDSGSSDTDDLTNVTTPTFTGTAEAGSTVRIYAGAVEVGSGVADGGTYSIQVLALAEGNHSISAKAVDGTGNISASSGTLATMVDTTAPSVTSSVIAKPNGYLAGAIKQAGSYYVYANIAETGGGVLSETADVTTVTSGGSTVTLSAGMYSANGLPYNYRSAALEASSALTSADGTRDYSIVSTDIAGNQRNQTGFNVIVDNTAPAAADIQTADGGGTVGRAETSDTISLTFSEPIDPYSILSGWDGSATGVVVRLIDGGCTLLLLCSDDSFQIFNAANSAALPFGTVDLNRADYHGGLNLAGSQSAITFGASGTASTMVQSGPTITITLGTASGTANTAGGSSTMVWSPVTSPYDAAANSLSGASVNESGSGDREF